VNLPGIKPTPEPPDSRIISSEPLPPVPQQQIDQIRFGLGNVGPLTQAVMNSNVPDLMRLIAGSIIPTGIIVPFAGATAPAWWLLCDGAAVKRRSFAELFVAIGTTYGVGDGSSTFNVPDLRGRAPIGLGTHADVDALADNDGVTLASRTPRHTHVGAAHTHTGPSHTHAAGGVFVQWIAGGGIMYWNQDGTAAWTNDLHAGNLSGNVGSSNSFTSGIATGGSTAAEGTGATGPRSASTSDAAWPPYVVTNYIIKT